MAADALIVEVPHDARARVLFVGVHRAAVHARRLDAVMARGGHRLLHGSAGGAAVQEPHRAPRLVGVETVQAVARRDARLAARAAIEIDAEGVLLPSAGLLGRQQAPVVPGLGGQLGALVQLSKSLDRRQRLLLAQIFVDERQASRGAARLVGLCRSGRRERRPVQAS
jgi:hypothetical protein